MRTSVRNKNVKRLQKYLNEKQRRGRRKQHSGFLNRYDFTMWDEKLSIKL